MLHLQTAAGPAIVTMLLGCVLGVGFMVCFLVALTLDGKPAHSGHKVRPGGHYAAIANSASHLAIGVARITTALASNAVRGNRRPSVDRLHVVPLGKTRLEVDFTAERRYRSG